MTADRAWMLNEDRYCRDVHPSIMHPEDGHIAARHICIPTDGRPPCPLLYTCRRYALDNHEVYGTWGGLSQNDRKRIWKGQTPIPEPIEHGTDAGYMRHWRRHERPCDDCRAAHSRACDERRRQKVSA